jgi:hypothetical protein
MLYILKTAYREFEERLGQVALPRGSKTEEILRQIDMYAGDFRAADLRRDCPTASFDLIRLTLRTLQSKGLVRCAKAGRSAIWQKTTDWELSNKSKIE